MKDAKFLEIVGNASTTATFNKKVLGRNVNACAYETSDGKIQLVLESNGSPVKGIPELKSITMSKEEYQRFKDLHSSKDLFIRGIELFGARTAWSEKTEKK